MSLTLTETKHNSIDFTSMSIIIEETYFLLAAYKTPKTPRQTK